MNFILNREVKDWSPKNNKADNANKNINLNCISSKNTKSNLFDIGINSYFN